MRSRMPSFAETVVLLTTWNRPVLLRQSLPQIELEAKRIGAGLVICDDQSSDPETLDLLRSAGDRGADLIRRPYVRTHDATVDECGHGQPRDAIRRLFGSASGVEIISECARSGRGEDAALEGCRRVVGSSSRRGPRQRAGEQSLRLSPRPGELSACGLDTQGRRRCQARGGCATSWSTDDRHARARPGDTGRRHARRNPPAYEAE
jgi:hypothetical protein